MEEEFIQPLFQNWSTEFDNNCSQNNYSKRETLCYLVATKFESAMSFEFLIPSMLISQSCGGSQASCLIESIYPLLQCVHWYSRFLVLCMCFRLNNLSATQTYFVKDNIMC